MKFSGNVLIESDFHDEHLTGLRMVNGDASLFIKTELAAFRLSIPNVVKLAATDFWEGNIIFGISLYAEPTAEMVKQLYGFTDSDPHNYFAVTMQRVRKERLTMFELTSSCGCEVLALYSGELEIEKE